MNQKKIDESMAKDISGENFERCVMCGKATKIPISTPIELRKCYEVGCGQLCEDCYKKIQKSENDNGLLF